MTNAEIERLALLMEECGEVVQVIGKILRHGYESMHPNGPPNNRQLLEQELGDVQYVVNLMLECADIERPAIDYHEGIKRERVRKYLHYNKGLGEIE